MVTVDEGEILAAFIDWKTLRTSFRLRYGSRSPLGSRRSTRATRQSCTRTGRDRPAELQRRVDQSLAVAHAGLRRSRSADGGRDAGVRPIPAVAMTSAADLVGLHMTVLAEGIVFGESPRWHDGRLWFSDWGAHQVIALGDDGTARSSARCRRSRCASTSCRTAGCWWSTRRTGGCCGASRTASLVTHAELASLADKPWNDIVVDGRGNAYVNSIGFEFPAEDPRPGLIALVTSDGAVRQVADDLAFPNGMAITDDGTTLLVAESYGEQVTAYDIERAAASATDGSGPRRRATTPTASAWMLTAPSGTPTWRPAPAPGSARAATCLATSRWTVARSRVR